MSVSPTQVLGHLPQLAQFHRPRPAVSDTAACDVVRLSGSCPLGPGLRPTSPGRSQEPPSFSGCAWGLVNQQGQQRGGRREQAPHAAPTLQPGAGGGGRTGWGRPYSLPPF